jgi:hypothetical protein
MRNWQDDTRPLHAAWQVKASLAMQHNITLQSDGSSTAAKSSCNWHHFS